MEHQLEAIIYLEQMNILPLHTHEHIMNGSAVIRHHLGGDVTSGHISLDAAVVVDNIISAALTGYVEDRGIISSDYRGVENQ